MYYLETGYAKHSRLRNAVIAALVAHVLLLIGVSFSANPNNSQAAQIAVTLAISPNAAAPEDASRIAQANQVGSGDESFLEEVTSHNPAPPQPESAAARAPRPAEEAFRGQENITTARDAERKISAERDQERREVANLEGISPEVDRLNRELQSLQAELDEQTRAMSNNPRVRRLTASSTRRSVDAAYLLDWRQRLEAVGNKYYPEASIRYGIYGNVKLMVIIRYDGTLEDVRVLSSSGYAVLDEAAIKVVRMAAPYSPFPAELRATTDKLEIVRTWQYLENQLSSK